MSESENRAAVERFWAALERKDFDAAGKELHEEFSESYPQSGERIVGADRFLGMLKAFPGFPDIRVRTHLGRDDLWVTHAEFDYALEGPTWWQNCEVQELRDARIWRITAFFGAPFEAAEWRKPYVEPISGDPR